MKRLARRALCSVLALVVSLPVATLAQDDPPSDLPGLLLALRSDDPDVQREVLQSIVALGASAAPDLEALALDATVPLRQRIGAVYALGRIGAPSSRPVLDSLWRSGFEVLGGALAVQVATALSDYGEHGALLTIVESGDEVLGAKAAIQLGLHQVHGARDALAAAYDDPRYERMRMFFAISLALVGDDRGADMVRSGLRSPELRNHCAVALAGIGEAGDHPFELEFALSDPEALVRRIALRAAIDVELPRLDRILETAASDTDPIVRQLAEETIERRARRRR